MALEGLPESRLPVPGRVGAGGGELGAQGQESQGDLVSSVCPFTLFEKEKTSKRIVYDYI